MHNDVEQSRQEWTYVVLWADRVGKKVGSVKKSVSNTDTSLIATSAGAGGRRGVAAQQGHLLGGIVVYFIFSRRREGPGRSLVPTYLQRFPLVLTIALTLSLCPHGRGSLLTSTVRNPFRFPDLPLEFVSFPPSFSDQYGVRD